jgi:hypothetical protein
MTSLSCPYVTSYSYRYKYAQQVAVITEKQSVFMKQATDTYASVGIATAIFADNYL